MTDTRTTRDACSLSECCGAYLSATHLSSLNGTIKETWYDEVEHKPGKRRMKAVPHQQCCLEATHPCPRWFRTTPSILAGRDLKFKRPISKSNRNPARRGMFSKCSYPCTPSRSSTWVVSSLKFLFTKPGGKSSHLLSLNGCFPPSQVTNSISKIHLRLVPTTCFPFPP